MPYYPDEKTEVRLPAGYRNWRAKRRKQRRIATVAVLGLALVAFGASKALADERKTEETKETKSTPASVACKPGEEFDGKPQLALGDASATATFTIRAGCLFVGGFDSWSLPEPVYSEPQVAHDRKAGNYGPGPHTLTVNKPRCWQLDLYRGVQAAGDWQYGNRLLATHIGGSKPCREEDKPKPEEPKPPVEEPKPPVDKPEEPIEGSATGTKRTPPAKPKRVEPTPDDSPELGTPPPVDQPGTLPFTGPRDWLLPAGLVLVLTGALMVFGGRRRYQQLSLVEKAVDRAMHKPYNGPHERL